MAIDQASAGIIFLINLIICLYALFQPQREKTRLFQLVMGAALMCWSGGVVLYNALEGNAAVLILPAVTVMLVPANFLSFALSFPRAARWVERYRFPLVVLYFPALVLVCLTDYAQLAESYPSYGFKTVVWERGVWTALPLFGISSLYMAVAAWLFNRRLREAEDPNDRDLFRYLLYSFIGALALGVTALATVKPAEGQSYPAPSMLLALLGQLGLFWAIRCLHEKIPEKLSRAVFLPLLALAIVFLILLTDLILEAFPYGPHFNELQLSVLMLVSVSISLLLVLFSEELQNAFDYVLFKRAYRYRTQMLRMHSELREARERLSRAERMAIVGEVAASVAHEIKNPLGPIKGYTQMMMRMLEDLPPSAQKERFLRCLTIICEEVDKINERVRRLMEFSRSQDFERRECRLEEIVQRAADLAQADASKGRELDVVTRMEENLPSLQGDPFRLHEAFFNIIQNGIQAMSDGGRLEIAIQRASSPGGQAGLEVRITDNGKGMTLEETRQMFKAFYTTREGGTGLGLGVVKSAIQAHRGEITVQSAPNKGTTVQVWLPVEPDLTQDEAAADS